MKFEEEESGLHREEIHGIQVWLVGEDEDNPGTFKIVEGIGFHGRGGWTVRVGGVVHWVEDRKVSATLEAAEWRLKGMKKEQWR